MNHLISKQTPTVSILLRNIVRGFFKLNDDDSKIRLASNGRARSKLKYQIHYLCWYFRGTENSVKKKEQNSVPEKFLLKIQYPYCTSKGNEFGITVKLPEVSKKNLLETKS